MNVPEDWPKPKQDKLMARCQVNYCGGAWLLYDHTGKIKTQGAAFYIAFLANTHNYGKYELNGQPKK